jgi:hypothetical protein
MPVTAVASSTTTKLQVEKDRTLNPVADMIMAFAIGQVSVADELAGYWTRYVTTR